MLWFLRGDTNIQWLSERGVRIWDEWADENGDLGPVYGKQWRDWQSADGRHIDQIANLVELIRKDPYSRRQIVTAWNPGEIAKMALAPCHCLFQTQVAAGRLNLQLYQRSADIFLGVPFNIASYALLTHMLARECGLEPGAFVWTGGDCHLYSNHLEQARLQLGREPRALRAWSSRIAGRACSTTNMTISSSRITSRTRTFRRRSRSSTVQPLQRSAALLGRQRHPVDRDSRRNAFDLVDPIARVAAAIGDHDVQRRGVERDGAAAIDVAAPAP